MRKSKINDADGFKTTCKNNTVELETSSANCGFNGSAPGKLSEHRTTHRLRAQVPSRSTQLFPMPFFFDWAKRKKISSAQSFHNFLFRFTTLFFTYFSCRLAFIVFFCQLLQVFSPLRFKMQIGIESNVFSKLSLFCFHRWLFCITFIFCVVTCLRNKCCCRPVKNAYVSFIESTDSGDNYILKFSTGVHKR